MESIRLSVFFNKLRGFFLTTSFFMLKYIQTQKARLGYNTMETAIVTIREVEKNTLEVAQLLQDHTQTRYNQGALIPAEKLIAEYFSEVLRLFHHKSSLPPTYSVPNLFVEFTVSIIREFRIRPSIIVHASIEKSDIHDVVDLIERAFKIMIASIVNIDQKTLHDRPVAALTKQNLSSFTKRHSDIQSKIQSRKARSQVITGQDKMHIKLPTKYSSSSSESGSESDVNKQESKNHK